MGAKADIDKTTLPCETTMVSSRSKIEWTGLGRWVSLTTAVLMIVSAVPYVPFIIGAEQVAGVVSNVFIGLLLLGAIVSNNSKAPLLVSGLAVFMAIRVLVIYVLRWDVYSLTFNAILLILLGIAVHDLRSQAANIQDSR